jgi:hypothetical protein
MYHLAQVNIAKARYALDDPRMADFMDNLARINKLGEDSPGFVWIMKDEGGEGNMGTSVFDDPRIFINLTVWESIEALKAYAYKTEHVEFLRRRGEWFERIDPYMALWWIPAGHTPSAQEAKEKLEYLDEHGETVQSFTFRNEFGVEDIA